MATFLENEQSPLDLYDMSYTQYICWIWKRRMLYTLSRNFDEDTSSDIDNSSESNYEDESYEKNSSSDEFEYCSSEFSESDEE